MKKDTISAPIKLILSLLQYINNAKEGSNEPCSMSKVATTMGFSKANMTQMVGRLIRKKFVKKIKNQNDQRITHIILLSKGKKIIDLNRAHIENVARSWFSNMTDEEQEGMLIVWEKYLFNDKK